MWYLYRTTFLSKRKFMLILCKNFSDDWPSSSNTWLLKHYEMLKYLRNIRSNIRIRIFENKTVSHVILSTSNQVCLFEFFRFDDYIDKGWRHYCTKRKITSSSAQKRGRVILETIQSHCWKVCTCFLIWLLHLVFVWLVFKK